MKKRKPVDINHGQENIGHGHKPARHKKGQKVEEGFEIIWRGI
jgi:hypothetical protein